MNLYPYAITFSKKGDLKYISHLDFVNTVDRALRKSKLPVYYTQGFNPKIKISFTKAYKVGEEILSDEFRIKLTEFLEPDIVLDTLKKVFPSAIEIVHVEEYKKNKKED